MGFDASTQITINGVPCWDEGTEEHFGRSATSAVYMLRSLRCPWSNRANLVKALQTGSQQIGSVTLITSGQLYPGPYANMYVDAIDITGEGAKGIDGNGLISFDWANLKVKYTPLDFTYAQIQLDFNKEIVAYPQSFLQFSDGTPVSQGAAFPVSTVCIRQSRQNLPSLPVSTILSATAAPLNSTPIFGAAAGTVLFDGGRSLSRYSLLANTLYDVAYSFIYKPIGWDKLFDPVSKTFKQVQTTDGNAVIQRSDLNLLFQ